MSDATIGQDQFQPVVNRRAGYGDALKMAMSVARKGGTLSAGEGLLIIEHYEEKLAATIGERERFMHRMYEARDDAKKLADSIESYVNASEKPYQGYLTMVGVWQDYAARVTSTTPEAL